MSGNHRLQMVLLNEGIAKLPPNRQCAASEGEERKQSVVTTLGLSDEALHSAARAVGMKVLPLPLMYPTCRKLPNECVMFP